MFVRILVAFTALIFLNIAGFHLNLGPKVGIRAGSVHAWTPLAGKVIVLDPGHGGPDGGAISRSGLIEKEVALQVALFLRDYLQQAGALVRMTRETDTDLANEKTRGYSRRKTEDLMKRAQMVNQSQGDLLISIHLNSFPNSRYSGAQTFYCTTQEESRKLAYSVQQELIEGLANTKRTAKKLDEVFLLNQSRIPAILVEIGFLSHATEAQLLADPEYQKKVAASIYRGILRYYTDPMTDTTSRRIYDIIMLRKELDFQIKR